jgi:hypothetical protein
MISVQQKLPELPEEELSPEYEYEEEEELRLE